MLQEAIKLYFKVFLNDNTKTEQGNDKSCEMSSNSNRGNGCMFDKKGFYAYSSLISCRGILHP